MKILGIDTSCDDTSIAIVNDLEILSNIVSSQIEIHKEWGGVFPALAKREHQKNLVPVLAQALEEAGLLKDDGKEIDLSELTELETREPELKKALETFFQKYAKPEIDAIALTVGPGLEPCLWTGINFAKALSLAWNLPIIPVHHIEAHLLSSFLEHKNIEFPALALVVSGGHTQLILIREIGNYEIIGQTLDDAAGECFDKVARVLGLEYPGGPVIEKLSKEEKNYPEKISFPRPMLKSGDYNFSFSGLKTAVLYHHQKHGNEPGYVQAAAQEAQKAIVETLVKKTMKAAKENHVKSLLIGGGVSASQYLRDQFEKNKEDVTLYLPSKKFSTDNAAMIAVAAYLNPKRKAELKADSNLKI